MKSLGGRLLVLVLGMLVIGLLLAPIAYGTVGLAAIEGLGYSLLLCLIPGLLTLLLSELLRETSFSPYVVLAGGGLRMVFVLLGLLAVNSLRPDLGFREFTIWLLVCYLAALAVETAVILAPAARGKSVNDQG
ncbi:MAG: hypothetical protein WCJ09_12180 [Planctomycetota bacterium]